MNPGNRDTPTEDSAQRLGSGDGHMHSKAGGSAVIHDHGRHSPASAHSPSVSGKLPGLHPDSGRSSRGFGTPSFSPTGLSGFSLDHLPFLLNTASSLIFPPFLHPSTSSLFPPVIPPNFLPPPLQPPLASLFPSPNAECEVSSSGWSAHSAGSRNTSSLGSTSSEGDLAAKIDGRTVRSSRCSPDVNLQPSSLSSSVRKIWESAAVNPVCISDDVDMPLSLVTRRETTSRGSSVAESGVCTGDLLARAASSETSRTPSLDGESGCNLVGENSTVQEQTVPTDQLSQWPAAKVSTDTPQTADDGKSSASDDVWTTPASRSSGIALPPRKRLTRNAEELSSSDAAEFPAISGPASSPSSAPNFRSCWKKFAAKSNISGPPSIHRAFGGKPQYDCRTYFQKLAEQAKAAAASKAFVPGKGKGHCYRNANKTSPRSSDQNTGSPRVTRSQSKPKKMQSPKSSPAEPPAPVRKSTRKKSINTRFDEYDRTGGKNKKPKSLLFDSNTGVSDGGKENVQAAIGDDVTNSLQRKKSRRGKHSVADGDSMSGDAEDNTSQSNEVSQPVSEADSKTISTSSSLLAAASEVSDSNAKVEDTVELQPSVVITVLPPKFRHFKAKTASVVIDSSQPQTVADQLVAATNESGSLEVAASVKSDSADVPATVVNAEVVTGVDECMNKPSLSPSTENSLVTETSGGTSTEESKVNWGHSVGGRKSLLYRSSGAAMDIEPSTEAKLQSSSLTECSAVVPSDAVSSADQTSSVETSADRVVRSDGVSVSKQTKVQSEQIDASLMAIASDATFTKINDKVQSGTDDEHIIETEASYVRAASPITDLDTDTSTMSAASNTASDHANAPANEESAPMTTELDSVTATSVDIAAQQRLGEGAAEVPADNHGEVTGSKSEPRDVSDDVTVVSSSQSANYQFSESAVDVICASVVAEPSPCKTLVTTVIDTTDVSCRILPSASTETGHSVPQNRESLKRSLPDDAIVNDVSSKRRRVNSPDVLLADTVGEPAHSTLDTNAVANFISSSDEQDSETCRVSNGLSDELQTTLSPSVQNSSKSKASKLNRTKITQPNRRLKLNRSRRVMKTAASAERPVLEKSKQSTVETEKALPAEIKSGKNGEKYTPPLLDGNRETPAAELAAVVEYSVANSVDKVCDSNSNVSLAQNNGEHKVLRISLVALHESVAASHRAKDSKLETVCDADKTTSSSAATMTAASVVNSLKQLTSVCSVDDVGPLMSSVDSAVSQDSVAVEHDSSTLLSQCKSLSVVLEKMQNSRRKTPAPPLTPPTTVTSSAGRQRRVRLTRRRFAPAAKPEVSANDTLLVVEARAVEPLATSSIEDEYRFSDDAVPDVLARQRLPRPERKTSSRKTRNSLPTPEQIEASPTATGDSTSQCATSSVGSSTASADTGESLTPNATQNLVAGKPETGNSRSRRRKRNLPDDEDTRSLSPITQNDSLPPAAFIEASLDGHKLKLRITKFANRSVEASTCDLTAPAPLPSSAEVTDTRTETKVDDDILVPDLVPTPSVEVIRERVNRRRRQLKVEGVRSRFLTLHKPSGVVPLADHVKCRLVKVGRRQWMSVGGEDADAEDDLSASQHSDAETTPVMNSPAAAPIDEIAQQPTRDRILLVSSESKKQRRRGRPPKAKTAETVLADTECPPVTAKRNKKRVKTDNAGHVEVSFTKPQPLPEVVTPSRPARVDPVPWLDGEVDGSDTQPYCALGDSSSRTITSDIDEYRLNVSQSAKLTSNVDRVISDVVSDCGVELMSGTVLAPKSMFFVPSELEQLMEALVLDGDLRRQPRMHSPPMIAVPHERAAVPSSAGVTRTFSYANSVSLPVFSPRNDVEVDLLLSQPSLRLQNCTSLPVDTNNGSDYDCAIVGYEYPHPDSVELPPLLDAPFVDEDCMLPWDPQLYSCVDLVL